MSSSPAAAPAVPLSPFWPSRSSSWTARCTAPNGLLLAPGLPCPVRPDQFGCGPELLAGKVRRGPVAARKVTAADGLVLARLEVRERVQVRAAVVALLGEPDLVAAD